MNYSSDNDGFDIKDGDFEDSTGGMAFGCNDYNQQFGQNTSLVFFRNAKPSNTLDYIKFNSIEYKNYLINEKIKLQLNGLNNLNAREIDEIFQLVLMYKPIIKINLQDLISIVAYKFIKLKKQVNTFHNNNSRELFKCLGLNKGLFIKHAKTIIIPNDLGPPSSESGDIIALKQFEDTLDSLISTYLRLVINYLKEQHIFPLSKVGSLEALTNIQEISNLTDVKADFQFHLKQIRAYYSQSLRKIYLEKYNRTKLEPLACAYIRLYFSKIGCKINLSVFKECFNVPISSISKSHRIINSFVK